MKKLFSTPKKAIISALCVVVVIAAVSVMAVKSSLITKEEAKAVALRDAGLNEAEASALRARLEFDDGRFQYEVDFYNNGTTYEYRIQAKDGDIIARDIEGGANGNTHEPGLPQDAGGQSAADREGSAQQQAEGERSVAERDGSMHQEAEKERPAADGDSSVQPQQAEGEQPAAEKGGSVQPQEAEGERPATAGNNTVPSEGKSLEEAKAAALKDAGLTESDVTFKKTELDHDHGMQVYDIEFYTSDTEYDYEINASDGTVVEKSVEAFRFQGNPADSAANSSNNNYIGVDRAKEIALNHANLTESDVRFAKAKLENDDGRVEYEIEFYCGATEYDYTIDAVSGNIIEYDVDYD
ncbi:MAG: PepSY domain-containing protein [Lachnospiraceae bacterium]|nr:PepSY domain-containing protein [Lachnospiraceae bacterium]